MKVAVYKNLNTGKWSVASVKETRNGFRKDKLIKHVDELTLENVSFYVGAESTRQRIINGHREVYAYAIGDVCMNDDGEWWDAEPVGYTCNVKFNPYESNDFMDEDDDGNRTVITDRTFTYMYFLPERDCDGNEVYAL